MSTGTSVPAGMVTAGLQVVGRSVQILDRGSFTARETNRLVYTVTICGMGFTQQLMADTAEETRDWPDKGEVCDLTAILVPARDRGTYKLVNVAFRRSVGGGK